MGPATLLFKKSIGLLKLNCFFIHFIPNYKKYTASKHGRYESTTVEYDQNWFVIGLFIYMMNDVTNLIHTLYLMLLLIVCTVFIY